MSCDNEIIIDNIKLNKNNSLLVEEYTEININIYRYKFTLEFTDELYKFSKIHQYDERKVFKEAWNIWREENENIISNEIRRLIMLGYNGDILDKMFKSARYYFRKKSIEKTPPIKRRKYVCIEKNILLVMDKHIENSIEEQKTHYKPSTGFDDFCKKNIDLLKEEVRFMYHNGLTDSNEIKNKIKKTYKNRYFLFISK
jgi:hypothetical protein